MVVKTVEVVKSCEEVVVEIVELGVEVTPADEEEDKLDPVAEVVPADELMLVLLLEPDVDEDESLVVVPVPVG